MTTLKNHLVSITGVSALFIAGVAHAQSGTIGGNISTFLTFVNGYVVPLIFSVAFLMFLWGIFRYFIAGGGNDESRKEGRTFILYALIGFFLMVSLWGLVNLLAGTVEFGNNSEPPFPVINVGNGGNNGFTNQGGL